MSQSFTLDQLSKLNDAIASGVKTVVYGDKTVNYHSLNEMLQLRKVMQQELGIGKKSRTKASFNKGLGAHASFGPYGETDGGDLYINSV